MRHLPLLCRQEGGHCPRAPLNLLHIRLSLGVPNGQCSHGLLLGLLGVQVMPFSSCPCTLLPPPAAFSTPPSRILYSVCPPLPLMLSPPHSALTPPCLLLLYMPLYPSSCSSSFSGCAGVSALSSTLYLSCFESVVCICSSLRGSSTNASSS